jgi:transmembrane sensor
MGTNHELDFKNLLDRMLSGELTDSERIGLQEYIELSYNDPELDGLMREHWLGLENKLVVDDETQFQNLKSLIISEISKTEKSHKKVFTLFPSNLKNTLMRVAAILFIPLLLGSMLTFYYLNSRFDRITENVAMQQVVASPGSRVHFTLPDKTEVWLNSESKLEFPMNLNFQSKREVKLIGQGYFKVAPDKMHPFIVMIDGIGVKALGTSFDVSGYENEMQIKSTLEEGSIALLGKDDNEMARLNPGQQAILNKSTQRILIKNVDTALSTSWKDGKLIFRNASLIEVTRQLERWYNCEIHLDNKLLDSGLFYTATIQDETLGEVLKMIEISTSVKTKIEKREVFIEKTK